MRYGAIEIVDTVCVTPANAAAMLALVRDRIGPVMCDAGARLIALRATSPDVGEDVLIQSVWGVADHAEWNRIRRNFFLDPRWHAASAEAASLRLSGTRRFFYPAEREAAS